MGRVCRRVRGRFTWQHRTVRYIHSGCPTSGSDSSWYDHLILAIQPPDPMTQTPSGGGAASRERPTHVRYIVLGLTVAAYMITYMDRQILAVARPVIRDELGISLVMMGWITFSFRIAYALFQIPGGWLGDRFGARRALTAVVTWWSVFTGITALAWNAVSMLVI